jgi:rhodanese-related sulfurtransferase
MSSRSLSILPALLAMLALCLPANRLAAEDKPAEKPKVPQISLEEFDQKRQEKDAVVLDVRSPQEFAEGHVPGAVNLNVHDPKFEEKVAALDKSKTYLVHCAKGVRSRTACGKMMALGFSNLFDFHGGFVAWENAHKPIERN